MEDCNHEMVNLLTQQIGTLFNPLIQETHNSYLAFSDQMFNPLIQETHNSYLALSHQMGRIADFFGSPPTRNMPAPQNQNPRPVEMPVGRFNNGIPLNQAQQHVVEPQIPRVPKRDPILVQRNQVADQIVRQAQQNNLEG
jgi:hypothetical protein